MKSIHLTDEVLQAFLLKEISDDAIVNHLQECSICQQRIDEYRFLIGGMRQATAESFSFDVTTVAMNAIVLYEKKRKLKQEIFFWGLLILLCMVVLSFAIPFMPQILTIFSGKLSSVTLLVIVTGFFVLLFLLTDISRQFKTKENKIFKHHLQPIL